jgi:hypothetical protein
VKARFTSMSLAAWDKISAGKGPFEARSTSSSPESERICCEASAEAGIPSVIVKMVPVVVYRRVGVTATPIKED